eukprot:98116-Prorocentrum_lima.AAC.1
MKIRTTLRGVETQGTDPAKVFGNPELNDVILLARRMHINVKWTFYDLPEDLLFKLHCCRRAADAA